jgi:OmpA-OmpF porin, OOP family
MSNKMILLSAALMLLSATSEAKVVKKTATVDAPATTVTSVVIPAKKRLFYTGFGFGVASTSDENFNLRVVEKNSSGAVLSDATIPFTATREGGTSFDIKVGTVISENTRLEVNAVTTNNDTKFDDGAGSVSDASASQVAYLLNVIRDIPTSTKVTPYVGAGIGMTNYGVKIDGASNEYKDTVLAYQALAGVGIKVSSRHTIDLGYKYLASGDPKLDYTFDGGAVDTTESFELSNKNHIFHAGVRYGF